MKNLLYISSIFFLFSFFPQTCCDAFCAPRPFLTVDPRAIILARAIQPTNAPGHHHSGIVSMWAMPDLTGPSFLTASMTTAENVFPDSTDVSIDGAFTDSIVAFDGPVRVMVIGFSVVMLILIALKALSEQMDAAIDQVLLDFEATLKEFYPNRWKAVVESLEGLEGDARGIKLLKIMEEMQEKEPGFMATVKEKMDAKSS